MGDFLKAGKTTLSNLLSELSEGLDAIYRPTIGCRIIEFETQNHGDKSSKMDIELWDCSGDKR